ncbi:MAG TPA: glycosyltransferase [Gemmatimonadales bacterium]|nr:glycosyltransferase [Gemmatimonadales bacterium]
MRRDELADVTSLDIATCRAPNVSPETSVVIRALNEGRWLPEVFAALSAQSYRDFDVVVVDSGSVDRTREIAEESGARIVHLRREDFTFGRALNIGIREAPGQLLAILSAHAIPAGPCWLERLVAPLRLPETAMVYGRQRAHDVSKFSEARDFDRLYPAIPEEAPHDQPFANNANAAVKRSLWDAHPFDESLTGLEDIEWARHWIDRGLCVRYEPNASVVHVHVESWPEVRHRYRREAVAACCLGLKRASSIPREVRREISWCAQDLYSALRTHRGRGAAGEILRFRYEKTVGIVTGLSLGRRTEPPGAFRARQQSMGYPRAT